MSDPPPRSLARRLARRLAAVARGVLDPSGGVLLPAQPGSATARRLDPRAARAALLAGDPPPHLVVTGDLDLRDHPGIALPSRLEVAGDLTLARIPGLGLLPRDLAVRGNLTLAALPRLAALPAGLSVGGRLTLEDLPALRALPPRMRLGGTLTLVRCDAIRTLAAEGARWPRRVSAQACARLTASWLPETDAITLADCPAVRGLPLGLRVWRHLGLVRCEGLAALPPRLDVPGDLNISEAPLVALPPGMRVAGTLRLHGCTRLVGLGPGLVVGRTLDLSGCSGLVRLPADLKVGRSLILIDCALLADIPEEMSPPGIVDVAGTRLRALPRSWGRVRLAWRGVPCDERVAFRPETITAREILAEANVELRRVKLERFGLDRFTREAGAKVLDRDRDRGGPRRLLRIPMDGRDEDIVCLEVRDVSTGKRYILRVPPETRTCRQAAAWLAGFDDPEAYDPIVET